MSGSVDPFFARSNSCFFWMIISAGFEIFFCFAKFEVVKRPELARLLLLAVRKACARWRGLYMGGRGLLLDWALRSLCPTTAPTWFDKRRLVAT